MDQALEVQRHLQKPPAPGGRVSGRSLAGAESSSGPARGPGLASGPGQAEGGSGGVRAGLPEAAAEVSQDLIPGRVCLFFCWISVKARKAGAVVLPMERLIS